MSENRVPLLAVMAQQTSYESVCGLFNQPNSLPMLWGLQNVCLSMRNPYAVYTHVLNEDTALCDPGIRLLRNPAWESHVK